ncbi:MAG: pilus assembly protein [Chloroflexi bacterium]|nr:pilus assembly protein [Chloroflexota bacterium]
MFAIGCVALVAICVFVAVVTIVILAILGPQIGTVFSRVTNGLANP